jgi:hypothetical protein
MGSKSLILIYIYQWLRLGSRPFVYSTALGEAEIIPGKHSDTRIKPLALANGHGRYMTVTPDRTLASVGRCPLQILYVSLPKRPCNVFVLDPKVV